MDEWRDNLYSGEFWVDMMSGFFFLDNFLVDVSYMGLGCGNDIFSVDLVYFMNFVLDREIIFSFGFYQVVGVVMGVVVGVVLMYLWYLQVIVGLFGVFYMFVYFIVLIICVFYFLLCYL